MGQPPTKFFSPPCADAKMLDKPKCLDTGASRMQRLTRNRDFRVLSYLIISIVAAFQVLMFLHSGRQHRPFFHSTLDMVLFFSLIAVTSFGIIVKSRQDNQ